MKKIGVVLTLAVAFCFAFVSVAQAGPVTKAWAKKNLHNSQKAAAIPVWKITQDGTVNSVAWVDATNPRFAVYDPGTPGDETDDVVLDKETGLVWERVPDTTKKTWPFACYHCYEREVGNRMGWRLPTIEELTSLVDNDNSPLVLPTGHPFSIEGDSYWSSTTNQNVSSIAYAVRFWNALVATPDKTATRLMWCVRGGHGHDAY